jgi:hypothetical protein
MTDDRPATTDHRRRPADAPSSFVGRGSSLGAWLRRVALSLVFACLCGLLAYLVARAVGGAALLVQQQALIGQLGAALRGGIEALAGSDIRAVRLELQRLDAAYQRFALLCGFAAAAAGGALGYLWLERRAGRRA